MIVLHTFICNFLNYPFKGKILVALPSEAGTGRVSGREGA